jgi:hypothetical protein
VPWYAKQGTTGQAQLKKSAKSPGPGWALIPGATDSMTQAQAAQQLLQDILHDNPGVNVGPGVTKAGQEANNAAKNLVPGLSAAEQALAALQNANTWIRVAKVIIGGALLLIGLAHMTGADNAVATAARTVPLPV